MVDGNSPEQGQSVIPDPIDTAQSNGASGGATPSLQDVVVQNMLANPSIVRDLITTSTNPQDYVPQSIMSRHEQALIMRILMKENLIETGNPDVESIIWFKMASSIAINGLARMQIVNVLGGSGGVIARARDRVGGMLGLGGGKNKNSGSQAQMGG